MAERRGVAHRRIIARDDPHDVRVGDRVVGNAPGSSRSAGVAPGEVVAVDERYVLLRKPAGRPGRYRHVRVLRLAVFADGRQRRGGYSVVAEADPQEASRGR